MILKHLDAYLRGKHPALFDRWLGFPSASALRMGACVERLKGFRFHRHRHYNLSTYRISLIERFLQKRISDILQYLEKADEYLNVSDSRVGVNSKLVKMNDDVKRHEGVLAERLAGDPLALQILWNLQANPLMTQTELSVQLGREKRTVERKVRKLREAGMLCRIGSDKAGSWKVSAKA